MLGYRRRPNSATHISLPPASSTVAASAARLHSLLLLLPLGSGLLLLLPAPPGRGLRLLLAVLSSLLLLLVNGPLRLLSALGVDPLLQLARVLFAEISKNEIK